MMNWKQLLSPQRSGQTLNFQEASRSAFEQDYDRIIFSHPFRRLQDKTQVHPLPEHDFVHTRLTHSLEVSSVGRSLGKRAGEVILQRHPELADSYSLYDIGAIVSAAALTHDMGNPPFGHAGEEAISDFFLRHAYGSSFKESVTDAEWADLTKFEGNAQGFRILTKNEYGLKLTFATLGAFTKYPCPSLFPSRDKKKKSQKKFGYFHSEANKFQEIATSLGLLRTSEISFARHPLAFLVEAADDICYSIIDLEDGCSLGLIPFNDARELFEGVITLNRSKLGKVDQLHSQQEKIGYLRALAIGDLMTASTQIFLDHEQEILAGKFDQALVVQAQGSDALGRIIDLSIEKIYRAKDVVEIEATGHEVIPGLLDEFTRAAVAMKDKNASRKYTNLQRLIPVPVTHALSQTTSDYEMLRLVIDFISGMTDRHAVSLFRKIKGMSL